MSNSDPRLSQAAASLEAIRDAFTGDKGIFPAEHAVRLRDPSTPEVVLERVRQTATAATEVLLVYVVAQVGINGQTGTPMLATAGVRPDDYLVTGLPLDQLLDAATAGDARVRIVLLDLVERTNASVAQRDWRGPYLTEASRRPGTCLVISQINAGDLPGDPAHQPTDFARELSDLLAGHSAAAVTVQQAAEQLERRLRERRPESSVRWQIDEQVAEQVLGPVPQPRPPAGGVLTTVVSGLHAVLSRGGRRASPAARGPLLPRLWRVLAGTWWGRVALVAVAAAVLATVAPLAVRLIPDLSAGCAPPLELRVLASPESYPAVRDAAGQYSTARLDADGCRTQHLTVYQATTDAVVRAFGQAAQWAQPGDGTSGDSPCAVTAPDASDPAAPGGSARAGLPVPGRDVGPQPDIWFPDSIVDVQRAQACLPRASNAVTFADPVPVARSPLVLGIPEARPGFPSPGRVLPWPDLLDFVTTAKLNLIRPNPTTSTAGLLHSVALYEALTGSPQGQLPPDNDLAAVRDFENSLVGQGVSMADTEDLLCGLDSDQPVPAVLVSEKALLGYNLGELSGCPVRPGQGRALVAYYPDDPLVLDYPAVRLTWASQTGDADQRRVAAQGFQDWLLSDAGQRLLTRYGLRPVLEGVPRDQTELLAKPQSGAWRDAPAATATAGRRPGEPEVQSAIDYYLKVRAPGQAVFLLDVSSSMEAQGNLDTAKRLIGGALDLVGPGDAAALVTVPKSLDDSGPDIPAPLYPIGAAPAEELRSQVVDAAIVPNDAGLYAAIEVALSAMGRDGATVKRTLVMITDGEDLEGDDGGSESRSRLKQVLGGVSAPTAIPIYVLALSPEVCDPQNFAALLTNESGGQCVTMVDSAAATKLGAIIFAGSDNG